MGATEQTARANPFAGSGLTRTDAALSVRTTGHIAVSSAGTRRIALRLALRSQLDGLLPARSLISPSLRSPLRT